MSRDVFISYSTQDKITADAVCAILESQDIRCWIAPRDVPLGSDWTEALVEAIESSPVMVLVFSRHANESRQIKREVNLAIESGKTVIPVRVEDVAPSKSLKFSINITHWLDAFPPPLDHHLRPLATQIRATVGRPEVAPKPEIVEPIKPAPNPPEPVAAEPEAAMLQAVVPEVEVEAPAPQEEAPVAEAAPAATEEVPQLPRAATGQSVSPPPVTPAQPAGQKSIAIGALKYVGWALLWFLGINAPLFCLVFILPLATNRLGGSLDVPSLGSVVAGAVVALVASLVVAAIRRLRASLLNFWVLLAFDGVQVLPYGLWTLGLVRTASGTIDALGLGIVLALGCLTVAAGGLAKFLGKKRLAVGLLAAAALPAAVFAAFIAFMALVSH